MKICKCLALYQIFICSILFTSCKDWLDVKPLNQLTEESLLSNEKGYFDALAGLYVKMRSNYRPDGFFLAGGIEYLGNVYYDSPLSTTIYLSQHDYTNTQADDVLGAAFLNQYNTISSINTLLEGMEKFGSSADISENVKKLVRGEALAMRAFLHFDLLRLWGPVPSDFTNKAYLPYAITVQIKPLTYSTYPDFLAALISDLQEAEHLLEQVDPILKLSNNELNTSSTSVGEYKGQEYLWRQNRLNYYAVAALAARVYAWGGQKDKAISYAKRVIEATNANNTPKFRLGAANDVTTTSKDYSLFTEHIFGLYVQSFDDQMGFNSRSASYIRPAGDIQTLYTDGDFRKTNFYQNMNFGIGQTAYSSRKYGELRFTTSGGKFSVPIIRLSEMYLILSEFAPLAEANVLFDRFQSSRAIANKRVLTENNRIELLESEYYREFFSEGQIFFMHKRWSSPKLRWNDKSMSSSEYVPDLPTGETGMRDLFQ